MRRIATVVACLGLLSAALHPRAQVARSPALSKIVPGYPAIISLEVPANDFSAFDAVRQILDSAEALYGLEGPVPADKPPMDFAQRTDKSVTLTGLTISA